MISGATLEQTVLGHALNDTSCYRHFISECAWQQFAAPNHRVLAFCLIRMADLGVERPDEDSFQLVVEQYPGDEKDYGGTEYVRQLKAAYLEPTDNYDKFVERLALQSTKHLIGGTRLQELARLANDPEAELDDIRKLVRQIDQDVDGAKAEGYQLEDTPTMGERYLQELHDRVDRPFHTTGFADLDDNLTEGFLPGKITVMAGFTGMAKTTVAINMAHRIACAKIPAAMFTMESTTMSLMDKVVSTLTQIPINRLKRESGELTDEERDRIEQAIEGMADIPLFINEQPSISIDGLYHRIRAAHRKGQHPKVVFIDLFGKVEDVDTGQNLAQAIQKEAKRMRVLARTLECHFVLIVQIGRDGFGRGRGGTIKRPQLTHIKNANAYSEEADLVLLLHRNKYYLPELEDDILEVEIAKQRDGESPNITYFEMFPDTSTIMATDKQPHDRGGNIDV